MELTGKTAIVTGASRGIGAAFVRKLAAQGAHVTVNYGRSAQSAEAVGQSKAFTVQADMSDTSGAHNLGPKGITVNLHLSSPAPLIRS